MSTPYRGHVQIKAEFREKYAEALSNQGGPAAWFGCTVADTVRDALQLTLFSVAGTPPVVLVPLNELLVCLSPLDVSDGAVELAISAALRERILAGEFGWEYLSDFTEDMDRLPAYDCNTGWIYLHGPSSSWRAPSQFFELPPLSGRALDMVLSEERVRIEVERASLRGTFIRITKIRNGFNAHDLTTELDSWLRCGGYIDAKITQVSDDKLRIYDHWVRMSDLTFTIIADPIKEGDLVTFRHYRTSFGSPLRSVAGHTPHHERHVAKMVNTAIRGTFNCTLCHPMDSLDTFSAALWEVRRISDEELAHIKEAMKPPVLERAEIEDALGPVLRDVIRQYPEAQFTRGMVFARTETALTEEEKSYEAIIERLCRTPGKLSLIRGVPSLVIPPDMLARNQKAHDMALGILTNLTSPEPVVNPLEAMDDFDLVEITIDAYRDEHRTVVQSRTIHYQGVVRVPASVLRGGRENLKRWLLARGDDRLPDASDEDFEDSEQGSPDYGAIHFDTLSAGDLDQFLDAVTNPAEIEIPVNEARAMPITTNPPPIAINALRRMNLDGVEIQVGPVRDQAVTWDPIAVPANQTDGGDMAALLDQLRREGTALPR